MSTQCCPYVLTLDDTTLSTCYLAAQCRRTRGCMSTNTRIPRLVVQLCQHVGRDAQQRLVHVRLEGYHVLPDEFLKSAALLFP